MDVDPGRGRVENPMPSRCIEGSRKRQRRARNRAGRRRIVATKWQPGGGAIPYNRSFPRARSESRWQTPSATTSPANGRPAPTSPSNRNPSDVSDVIGEYAQADAAQARSRDRRGARGVPGMGRGSIAGARRTSSTSRQRDPRAQGRAGRLLSREEGKTLPEGIGEAMRAGHIFKFFAGEVLRLARRARAVGASRRRRRDHARAGRRRRHHHAVEFSDRDSRVEDRAGAGLRQLRGVQAGRPGAGLRLGARRHHRRARACRRACSTW